MKDICGSGRRWSGIVLALKMRSHEKASGSGRFWFFCGKMSITFKSCSSGRSFSRVEWIEAPQKRIFRVWRRGINISGRRGEDELIMYWMSFNISINLSAAFWQTRLP